MLLKVTRLSLSPNVAYILTISLTIALGCIYGIFAKLLINNSFRVLIIYGLPVVDIFLIHLVWSISSRRLKKKAFNGIWHPHSIVYFLWTFCLIMSGRIVADFSPSATPEWKWLSFGITLMLLATCYGIYVTVTFYEVWSIKMPPPIITEKCRRL